MWAVVPTVPIPGVVRWPVGKSFVMLGCEDNVFGARILEKFCP